MPTNLYGPGDNFDLTGSHVLPALLRRFAEAAASGAPEVVLWGTGTPRREFLHVDDLAAACLVLLERYDSPNPINVGTGRDITIREVADLVADVVGFTGRILTDPGRPDGTPRKLLDVSRLRALGWELRIGLREGSTRPGSGTGHQPCTDAEPSRCRAKRWTSRRWSSPPNTTEPGAASTDRRAADQVTGSNDRSN